MSNKMSNLTKLCAAFKTVKNSFLKNKIINSVPAFETQFFRLYTTPTDMVSFFIQPDDPNGWVRCISGRAGESFYTIISRHKDIVGYNFGMCRGTSFCTTCHIKLPRHVFNILPRPVGQEQLILGMTPNCDSHASRLACAVTLTEDMGGITVIVPTARSHRGF